MIGFVNEMIDSLRSRWLGGTRDGAALERRFVSVSAKSSLVPKSSVRHHRDLDVHQEVNSLYESASSMTIPNSSLASPVLKQVKKDAMMSRILRHRQDIVHWHQNDENNTHSITRDSLSDAFSKEYH